jgi:hypothetical protein
MKMRIRGNSVRFRLTKSEVSQFCEIGKVEETVEFGLEPQQKFIYAVEATDAEKVSAVFENNRLCVLIPEREAKEWTNSNQVGIKAAQTTGGGEKGVQLRILVEKDFACLENRPGEDDSDAFPHPLEEKLC